MSCLMEELIEEADARIERVYHASKYLRELHEDVAVLEHALFEEDNEKKLHENKPYEPTFFLYVFFSFNMLYDIDWTKSVEEGEIVDATVSDEDKIRDLVNFCFPEDDSFPDLFFPSFYDIVTLRAKGEVSRILRAMDSIIVDNKKITANHATNCKSDFRNLLTRNGFTCRNAKDLAKFIYKVRCNLVHGTKTFDDLKNPKQRERILYYSFFLIALQHMLFMRLESLCNGFFSKGSDRFISKLHDRHWLPAKPQEQ